MRWGQQGWGDRKERRARGKEEGLNHSSKGSPRTHGCLCAACEAQERWAIVVFLPARRTQPCKPSLAIWGLVHAGMEETVVRPSVFVVDGQTDIPFRRLERKPQRLPCSAARLGLVLLLLLLMTGLALQGWFLLHLHWRLGQMVTSLPVSGGWGPRGGQVFYVPVCLSVHGCAGQGTDSEQPRQVHSSP